MPYIHLTDPEEMRIWIEEHNGEPAVRRDSDDVSPEALSIRFDTKEDLEPISWEEFFDIVATANLVLKCKENNQGDPVLSTCRFIRSKSGKKIHGEEDDWNENPQNFSESGFHIDDGEKNF